MSDNELAGTPSIHHRETNSQDRAARQAAAPLREERREREISRDESVSLQLLLRARGPKEKRKNPFIATIPTSYGNNSQPCAESLLWWEGDVSSKQGYLCWEWESLSRGQLSLFQILSLPLSHTPPPLKPPYSYSTFCASMYNSRIINSDYPILQSVLLSTVFIVFFWDIGGTEQPHKNKEKVMLNVVPMGCLLSIADSFPLKDTYKNTIIKTVKTSDAQANMRRQQT